MCVYIYKIKSTNYVKYKMNRNIEEATPFFLNEHRHQQSWDDDFNRSIWIKLKENKYMRKLIHHDKNIMDDQDIKTDTNFHACSAKVDRYLKFMYRETPFKKIPWVNDDDINTADDDYILNENFRKSYSSLMKCVYAMKALKANIFMIFTCKIFDSCNVIAVDLENNFIMILYNSIIYIIFYVEENMYIKLNIKERMKIDGHTFQEEVKEFILQFEPSIVVYYNRESNDNSKKNVFGDILDNFQTKAPSLINSWSKWDDFESFFRWRVNKKEKIYSRECIHFRYSLRDIYNSFHKGTRELKDYPLKNVCNDLFYFNYLFAHHDALIYNNVVYIDFNRHFFIVLNISEGKMEVMNVSFLPFLYKGDTSNDITIPFSNFIIETNHDKLYFEEYIKNIV